MEVKSSNVSMHQMCEEAPTSGQNIWFLWSLSIQASSRAGKPMTSSGWCSEMGLSYTRCPPESSIATSVSEFLVEREQNFEQVN